MTLQRTLLLLAITVASTYAYSQQSREQGERLSSSRDAQAAQTQAQAKRTTQPAASAAPPAVAVQSNDSSARSEKGEKETEDRENRNLKAAERSADAAEDQARVAWWSLGFSIVGAIGLFLTIHYARKAVREATRSADVAMTAVSVAQNTAERQLRAYVYLTDPKIILPQPLSITPAARAAAHEEVILSLGAVNTGQTPAHNLHFVVSFCNLPRGATFAEDFDYPRIPRQLATGQVPSTGFSGLAPGASATNTTTLNDAEIADMMHSNDGQFDMFVYGQINYLDVFDVQRRTEFCLQVKVIKRYPGFSPMVYVGTHNKAT